MKITKRAIMAMASFVLLLLQAFGLKIDVPVVNEVISALAGVLVILGIISDGSTSSGKDTGGSGEDETPTGMTGGSGADETPTGMTGGSGADETPTGMTGESGEDETANENTDDGADETSADPAGGSGKSPEELPPLSHAEGDETDKNGAISGEEGEKSAEKTDNGLN